MCEYFCIGLIDFVLKDENGQITPIYFLLTNVKRMIK